MLDKPNMIHREGQTNVTIMASTIRQFAFASSTRTEFIGDAQAGIETAAQCWGTTGHAEEFTGGYLEFGDALDFGGGEEAELEMGYFLGGGGG